MAVPRLRFGGAFNENGEWVEFTDDWEQRKLAEILTERHILTTITDEYPRLSFTIEDGVISPEDRKTNKRDFLMKDEMSKKFLVTEVGDIIYNPANVIFGALHKNDYAKGCLSPIYRIFYSDYDTTYLECILRADSFIQTLSQKTEGTVVKLKTLKPEAFLGMKIYVTSSVKEQKKIAEYFNNIDHLITLHQRELEKLKELKKAMLQKMFPRNGARVPEVRFPSFTDDWEQRKLEDVVVFLDTKRKPLEGAKRIKGPYPYYGASGIVDYVDGYLFDEELILLSEDGANIADRNYPVCFLASGKYWVNNHAHVLKTKYQNENNFVCNSLERKDFTPYNSGMAMPKLNQEVCRNIPIQCPEYEEQKRIGDFFRKLDTLITLHQRELEKYKEFKKGSLQQMFV